ncbi:MAG: hsp70 family protein [Desulfobacteraceae bacterium]|nr:hsp70 family protein [Desulfobacteraceae bacterium]
MSQNLNLNSENQSETEQTSSYIIGIDLGTTNSAVSYAVAAEPSEKYGPVEIFQIAQCVALGEFGKLPVLPSFFYIPGSFDIDLKSINHPWPKSEDHFTGSLARDHGSQVPARLVSSAKSWLCHANVDRHGRILPWGAGDEVAKVSPVQASAAYLEHIRKAWNHARGDEEEHFLENQNVIITVPASFDEVARELTLAAATMAGYRDVTLLEEPLAAFYSWLMLHEKQWQSRVQPNELILICDVGGGTTDFTLVTLNEIFGSSPRFERIAVGDHLILGGDNVDLALARMVEAQWSGRQSGLDTNRWKSLCHQCRQAKEKILSGKVDSHRITLMGSGSGLIAGTITAELDRAGVEKVIMDGFFPFTSDDGEGPKGQRAAITEFGLPYEPEAAITRHLHRFLERHRQDVAEAIGKDNPLPDLVLFNGGALKPEIIQHRIVEDLFRSFGGKDSQPPRILENRYHDTAVALGASYYGRVKTGQGVRVGSGSPRAYYLGVGRRQEDQAKGAQTICLVERGLDEGTAIELGERQFQVLANQPVRFELFSSSYRSKDRIGDLVTVDDSLMPMPPMQTVIRYGKKAKKTKLPVSIEAEYTELGTLSLWCRSQKSEHRWALEFQLRDMAVPTQVSEQTILDQEVVKNACQAVQTAFKSKDQSQIDGLVKKVIAIVDLTRDQWPLSLIREMADCLLKLQPRCSQSAIHEARWMNLTGFCLRPGFGDALDAERIRQVWKIHNTGAVRPKHAQVQSEWWIMWRRLSGGLAPGQQRQLSQELSKLLQGGKSKKVRLPLQRQLELWMAVANLERLYVKDKVKWGRQLITLMQPGQVKHQHFWSLSRLGARELLYGPADRVIPAPEAALWIDMLLSQDWNMPKAVGAALVQLARKTGDRTRDVEPEVVDRIVEWMEPHTELEDKHRYLLEVIPMERQQEQDLFGESLPSGIVLHG